MTKLRGVMIHGYQVAGSTTYSVQRALAIDQHGVSTYAQIAGTLPHGMHAPFND